MKTIIVADRRREQMALKLWAQVGGEILWDNDQHGAAWNHHRALQKVAAEGQAIIIEDDAIPVPGFHDKAQAWVNRFPDRLISFYLGTGRPFHFQRYIEENLHQEYLEMQYLHGVCYTLPQDLAQQIVNNLPDGPIDEAIAQATYSLTSLKTIFPTRSLADHTDSPSVETHPDGQPRTEPRKAWQLDESL